MSISRRWCFTLNNWNVDHEDTLKTVPYLYLVYGKESSISGTPHLQGFITFKGNKRLSALKKLLPTAHWEIAQGTSSQAADYCKKGQQSHDEWKELGTEGPNYGLNADVYEQGDVPSQGKRNDLDQATSMIKEGSTLKRVAEEHPSVYAKFHKGLHALKSVLQDPSESEEVRGIWIHGPPGVGKSYAVRKVLAPDTDLYIKSQNKWWDNYQGEEFVLIDDFDVQGETLGHHMKLWADRYKATGEVKGSSVSLRHKWLFITSNYEPCTIWAAEKYVAMIPAINRRFHKFYMTEDNRDEVTEQIKSLIT